jgi:DNA topoisomerase-6 subunit B
MAAKAKGAKGEAAPRAGRRAVGAQLELVPVTAPARGAARPAATLPDPGRERADRAPPRGAEGPDEVEAPAVRPGPRRRATAEQMAQKQREISISEFFTKNRHLLGFDNSSKALLTTIKEAVDNSLDACEEAGILPEITIEVRDLAQQGPQGELTRGEGRFLVIVEDGGPGIVKAQVPKIFGKLLYGSKFHRLKQ